MQCSTTEEGWGKDKEHQRGGHVEMSRAGCCRKHSTCCAMRDRANSAKAASFAFNIHTVM